MNTADVCIYGDSLMKGTIPTEMARYKFTISKYLNEILRKFPLQIINRARFGAPVTKGKVLLKKDLERSVTAKFTLLEYGGNDCNFDWNKISAEPEVDHSPTTSLEMFLQTLEDMIDALFRAGSTPVLMSLPPIDSEKYLTRICMDPGCDRNRILSWLGDINMIYRYHELYSNSIVGLAVKKGLQLIDVRSRFLDKRNYKDLISEDGIHPSEKGYDIISQACCEQLQRALS